MLPRQAVLKLGALGGQGVEVALQRPPDIQAEAAGGGKLAGRVGVGQRLAEPGRVEARPGVQLRLRRPDVRQ